MTKGFSRHPGARISFPRFIVILALVLSVCAGIIIVLLVLTAGSANEMMSIQKKEPSNIPSNILPAYSQTNFTSFDNQTNLSGWFFKTTKTDKPISTIIVVHDTGSNKMFFDLNTVDLIEDMLGAKYNVFLFDLRNSGESEGATSGYGYLEWMDVIGAISHVRQISVTKNVILYGIGSGCSAALLAIDKLPAAGEYGKTYDKEFIKLAFDRSYIIGTILDSPAKNTDDYIIPLVSSYSSISIITKLTVPYAIRISAGESSSVNLFAEISRLSIPVCILYGDQDTFVGTSRISQIVTERERLHPSTTASSVFAGAGYVESFEKDPAGYRKAILDFLTVHFN